MKNTFKIWGDKKNLNYNISKRFHRFFSNLAKVKITVSVNYWYIRGSESKLIIVLFENIAFVFISSFLWCYHDARDDAKKTYSKIRFIVIYLVSLCGFQYMQYSQTYEALKRKVTTI